MDRSTTPALPTDLRLRLVEAADLPSFFVQQLDADANYMAAFTTKDPADHQAFTAHWTRILAEPSVMVRTIVVDGHVAGYVSSYEDAGKPEVTYWLDKDYWGKGVATRALTTFLAQHQLTRPIFARVAQDNPGSLRVLEKCGFIRYGADRGFANARGEEVAEYLLRLDARTDANS